MILEGISTAFLEKDLEHFPGLWIFIYGHRCLGSFLLVCRLNILSWAVKGKCQNSTGTRGRPHQQASCREICLTKHFPRLECLSLVHEDYSEAHVKTFTEKCYPKDMPCRVSHSRRYLYKRIQGMIARGWGWSGSGSLCTTSGHEPMSVDWSWTEPPIAPLACLSHKLYAQHCGAAYTPGPYMIFWPHLCRWVRLDA